MNNSWPLNQESLKRRSKKKNSTPEGEVARKLFPIRFVRGTGLSKQSRVLSINEILFNDVLKTYPTGMDTLIQELWYMFNHRRKTLRAAPGSPGAVAHTFVRNETPEPVLVQVNQMVTDVAMLDATLQLTRCPEWLAAKTKKIIVRVAIDEESYAIHASSRLDYMGEYKRFKREVELY